ncbi:single-pass membrane and coiled-coil domain-containing protein 1-like [Megalops cyprinoides]|uniref:single-pass membrane and coiled-coil domain-containing protein 1-like n=1 Tax=Megalops cyprinoides TaxID=118141 RepID=UPI001864310D|nr:single-pass membrane and coiled-coil domain-containing protein 1-like [Megalops cyprinoides]
MTSEEISLRGFSATLSRLERRLEAINTQFEELDEAARRLTERLEQHRQDLAVQAHQDQVWGSLLEDKFTTVETNLFFTYVADALCCCHEQVVRKLPDLAQSLPTTACILRRKIKNRRIDRAWESTIRDLGLEHSDIKALCAFFVTHGYQAEYYNPFQRRKLAEGAETLVQKAVRNPVLRDSLLRAVQVVEEGKAGTLVSPQTEEQKPSPSIREQLSKQIMEK